MVCALPIAHEYLDRFRGDRRWLNGGIRGGRELARGDGGVSTRRPRIASCGPSSIQPESSRSDEALREQTGNRRVASALPTGCLNESS